MSVLHTIAKKVRERVEERMKTLPKDALLKSVKPRTLASLKEIFPVNEVNIIAEVKKASPSEGDLAPSIDPVKVGASYLHSGAKALSVLTEEDFFKGHLNDLRDIRASQPDAFILMKDFILDEYQILEGLKCGASSILLILSLLDDETAKRLLQFSQSLGLHALVEVHDEVEMKRALKLKAPFIGINNRNLKTMKIDVQTSFELQKLVSPETILISESGLKDGATLRRLQDHGFHGFLMGTHFMKKPDPGLELAQILKEAHK